MRAPSTVPCDRCGRNPSIEESVSPFSFCGSCGLYVCARCWSPAGRCKSCLHPGIAESTQSRQVSARNTLGPSRVTSIPSPKVRPIARPRPSPAPARPHAVPRGPRSLKTLVTAQGVRRAALFATEDIAFRVVLATLLAIGAMFGLWAVVLTSRDAPLVPAQNIPAAQGTVAPTGAATPVEAVVASRVFVVRRGDTLRRVAAQAYGDESLWRLIYDANRDRINDPENLLIGTRLRIPDR